MYQRRNGRQLIIIGLVVIGLVLGIGLLVSRLGGGGGGNNAAATPQTSVVVALQPIPQGTSLSPSTPLTTMFGVRQVPTSLVPLGAYTSLKQLSDLINSSGCQPAKVPGCSGQITTTQTLFQNLPVVSGEFSTLGQFRTAAGPAFQIPYGYVGIALSFSAVNSVLGSIQAGDDIDVMATNSGTTVGTGPQQTQYAMNDLRVIGVNGPPAPPPAPSTNGAAYSTAANANSGQSSANAGGGTLLVLARYQQALVIQHLKDSGWTLSAVLRSAKETDIPHFHTTPVTDRWFFIKTSNKFELHQPY